MTLAAVSAVDRAGALERFRRIRARTRAMFDLLDESVYYDRPIPLRNPIVFYEGHLPAFAVNTLLKRALGRRGIDAGLEEIFARGIDPDAEAAAIARGNPAWPSRSAVRAYAEAADDAIEEAIESARLDVPGHPTLDRAQALWTVLEHEEMHQETLAYMWHELPYEKKHAPSAGLGEQDPPCSDRRAGPVPWTRHAKSGIDHDQAQIPAGIATLGTGPEEVFAWDNERPAHRVSVPAFAIDVHNVTNAAFMAFVDAGGYRDARWWRADDWAWIAAAQIQHPRFWVRVDGAWYWRGMFERIPLPGSWPVYVTWAEANAFARWRGMRLPTEAEFHRAAFGTPAGGERRWSWGDTEQRREGVAGDREQRREGVAGDREQRREGVAGDREQRREGVAGDREQRREGVAGDRESASPPGNVDFKRWDPEPIGSHPEAASAFGVHDLVGNGWEWTSTTFGPFEGFVALPSYPEYSADFFDGDHVVMKGASPVTAAPLLRRGFRNWFRPRYPYVYATFRCVASREVAA